MLARNPIVVQVKRCLRIAAKYITCEEGPKENAAHGSAKLRKLPRTDKEELRETYNTQDGSDDASQDQIPNPLQLVTPTSQVKVKSSISRAPKASFQGGLNKARLGKQHEALGSHPWKPSGAWPSRYKFREVGGQGIKDTEDEVNDGWSTLVNPSTNTVCNAGSEQDLSSAGPVSVGTVLRLKREAACRPCEKTKAQRDRMQTEAFIWQTQCEKMQTEASKWRIKCDTLRGEKSDLQRLVNRARWVAEEWQSKEQVSGAQAMSLLEEMLDRLLWCESRCPELYGEFDKLAKRLKIEAKICRENRRRRRRREAAQQMVWGREKEERS